MRSVKNSKTHEVILFLLYPNNAWLYQLRSTIFIRPKIRPTISLGPTQFHSGCFLVLGLKIRVVGNTAMDMECTGRYFINTKILITGALIPTGVAISEQFYIDNLGGNVRELLPLDLNSANGASSNSTMKTVGQIEVKIRFNNLSTIFSGSAVVLKNLSLPPR